MENKRAYWALRSCATLIFTSFYFILTDSSPLYMDLLWQIRYGMEFCVILLLLRLAILKLALLLFAKQNEVGCTSVSNESCT